MTNRERICEYCGKTFTIRATRGGSNRMACYDQPCLDAHKECMRVKTAEATEVWRVMHGRTRKGKHGRCCSICEDPLPENRYFYHDYCKDRADLIR